MPLRSFPNIPIMLLGLGLLCANANASRPATRTQSSPDAAPSAPAPTSPMADDGSAPGESSNSDSSSESDSLPPGKAINAFSFNLFSALAKGPMPSVDSSGPDAAANILELKNKVISGYSIYSALALAYMGTTGKSLAGSELATILGIDDRLSKKKFAIQMAQLQRDLARTSPTASNTDSKFSEDKSERQHIVPANIKMANLIVVDQKTPIKPNYIKLAAFMGAELQTADLAADSADKMKTLARINAWSKEKTEGNIAEILDDLKPYDVMLFLNAISFKGQWRLPFMPTMTKPSSFFYPGGKTPTVNMMEGPKQRYLHYAGKEGEIVELFYDSGDEFLRHSGAERLRITPLPRFSMLVFLPPRGTEHLLAAKTINPEQFQKLIDKMKYKTGVVLLPKFRVESAYDLKQVLISMGIASIFNKSLPNFPGIMDSGRLLHISNIVHKTIFEVNEHGTDATAVSTVTAASMLTLDEESDVFTFTANRPFLFFIRDYVNKTFPFQGSVISP